MIRNFTDPFRDFRWISFADVLLYPFVWIYNKLRNQEK